ncbi:MAG: TonB-dependent receptor [Acidobacteriota bacterium]
MSSTCSLVHSELQLSKPRAVRRGALALAIAALWAAPALAADLSGRVVDADGAPIAQAVVQLLQAEEASARFTSSDELGSFSFADVHCPCDLRVERVGYRPLVREIATTASVDLTLESLDPVSAEILVSAGLPELASERRLGGEEIDAAGAADLILSLRDLGGLDAVRRGPINLEPQVRGLGERQVTATVDGTRTFAAGPARMDSDLSHVGPHAVEEVRVIKGPYALTWGSGALSAIDVRTRQGRFESTRDDRGARFDLGLAGVDNGDRLDAFGNVWGGSERWRWALLTGRRDGSDFDDGDGIQVPGDYTSTDLRLAAGWRPSDAFELEISGGFQDQNDIDYPGRLLDATYFTTRSIALGGRWSGEGAWRDVEVRGYSNRKDHRMNNDEKPTARDMPGRTPPFALSVDLPTESNAFGGRMRARRGDEQATWTLGGDGYRLEQTATRTVSRRADDRTLFVDRVWPDAVEENLGGYVQWLGRLGRGIDAPRLGATVRLDAASSEAEHPSEFLIANTIGSLPADATLDEDDVTWSAAVSTAVDLGATWSFEAGVGRAVRQPSTLERYSDRFPSTRFQIAAEFLGDPLLAPETSLQFDVALLGRRGRWSIEISGFARRIDDVITVIADPSVPKRLPLSPPTVYRYRNGDEARAVGLEAAIDHRVNDRLSWRLDASWLRADDETFDEPQLGVPPLEARLAARWSLIADRLWLAGDVRWVDAQDRVAVTRFEQETDGFTVVGLSLRWGVSDALRLELDIENVFDEAYAEHLNAPNPFSGQRIAEPGRSVRAAVRWRL